MKLSDYVASFLYQRGIKHAFAVAGGACLHLMDSVDATEGIELLCPNHEQAGAMAADAYARVSRGLGTAIATSGPGATNMITGICCAYYDSVPVLYLTGQVATFRLKGNTGVRQMGFQETEIVTMCKSITKYAVMVEDPQRIRYELEKACYLATTGRPGPVLVDIPDNLQREQVDPETLEAFIPEAPKKRENSELKAQIAQCLPLLQQCKRPVIILGWGVRLSGADAQAVAMVQKLGFPVVPTWGILDLFPFDQPELVGPFGLHGTRYGNFAVQNADLIISVGTRLDTHETGSPLSSFAREARKIVVDVDPTELKKFEVFGMKTDVLIAADAKEFMETLSVSLEGFERPNLTEWQNQILRWKNDFPICPQSYYQEKEINPYVFVKALARASSEGDTFVVDTGCAVAWMTQAFEFKKNQRMYAAFNNTPMGYALPASIGASLALGGAPVSCIVGDGSLMMNIQEMPTVLKHKLPIKIFLINNHGYSMIQQTQDQWLQSKYVGSSADGGLAFPNFEELAKACGYPVIRIDKNQNVHDQVREVLTSSGPFFCNVDLNPNHRVIPQVVYGRPIEDAGPLLPREQFLKSMIVKPMDASLKDG